MKAVIIGLIASLVVTMFLVSYIQCEVELMIKQEKAWP